MRRYFAMVDVNYFDDDRVLAAGADWQLHLAAILACKRLLTDGALTRSQLARIAPDSLADIARSISHLIEVGLFIDKGDSIAVHAWGSWNASSEDVEAMAQGGEYGNHVRWHLRRDAFKPECKFCRDSPDSPPDSPPDSGPESQSRYRDRDKTPRPFEADFAALYGSWRKKGDRAEALRNYQARRRAGVTHEMLVLAAQNYIEATKGAPKERTKGLAPFLSGVGGPWSEYLEARETTISYDVPDPTYT